MSAYHEIHQENYTADNKEYILENLDKAIGHMYRATYDIFDWLSINLRSQIIEEMKPYSAEIIEKVIPQYYTDYRSKIDQITEKISELRQKKDVSNKKEKTLPGHEEYKKLIDELIGIYKHIM